MPIKKCVICDKEFYTKTTGKTCSLNCRRKLNVIHQNGYALKANPNKLLGIGSGNHPNNKRYNKSASYIHYKKDKCELCGSTENLLVHHKDHNRKNCNPDNLMTLCKRCHQIHHVRRDSKGRFIKTRAK